jgi:hypothetical protein
MRVTGVQELRGLAASMKRIEAPTRAAIRRESAEWAPDLRRAIARRAPGKVEARIAATTRTTVTSKGLKAVIGGGGKLSGGARIGEVTRPYEFGTTGQNVKRKVISRRRGKAVIVHRRTMRQIPGRKADGRFIYQGMADATPRLVGRYVRALMRILEGG